jgi:hypothetical protein
MEHDGRAGVHVDSVPVGDLVVIERDLVAASP